MHPHRMATAWHGIASHASKGCAAAAGWAHAPAFPTGRRTGVRKDGKESGIRYPGCVCVCVCVCRVKERGLVHEPTESSDSIRPQTFSAGGGGGEERGEREGEGRGRAEPAEL